MLRLEGVSKRYGDTVALAPTDLTFPARRTTALVGPSGGGKSTLLRLINGLLAPDTGRVLLDETAVTPDNVLALRRRMGYVIQEGGLFPHLTARRNVTLMAEYLGWGHNPIGRRVEELTDLARLSPDLLDRFPAQLSGGQRQRVALMRALMLDPDVLLLDEPLAALDPMIRHDLQDDLKAIFRELGKTVVLVTHDMSEAGYLGEALVLLREGRIIQQGSFKDLVNHPAEPFVHTFLNAQRPRIAVDGTQ